MIRQPAMWLSCSVLCIWACCVVFGNHSGLDPTSIDLTRILKPPSAQAWLGYDDLGRSILDRMISGARVSFLVSIYVVTLSAIIGIVIGILAGWYGGRVDQLLVYLIDTFMAFPGILLAIALAAVLGPGLNNLVIALITVGWVGFARLSRAQTLSIRSREHIKAAESMGTSTFRTLTRHVLPLILAPLIVEASFGIAGVIIAEAGLSFLGLGIQPPEASWGSMIRDGTRYMLVAPHMVLAPGLALCLVVLSVNMLGDKLRDRMDNRL